MSHSNCLCVIGVYTYAHTCRVRRLSFSVMRERRAVAIVTALPFTQTKRQTNTIERTERERERERQNIMERQRTSNASVFGFYNITSSRSSSISTPYQLCIDPQGSFEELFCHFLIVTMEGRKYDGPQLINNDIRCGIMDG